jgi:hypothetical protein
MAGYVVILTRKWAGLGFGRFFLQTHLVTLAPMFFADFCFLDCEKTGHEATTVRIGDTVGSQV